MFTDAWFIRASESINSLLLSVSVEMLIKALMFIKKITAAKQLKINDEISIFDLIFRFFTK
jgi:hypothetical protein